MGTSGCSQLRSPLHRRDRVEDHGLDEAEKTLPALRDQADTGDRGSTAAQAATRASRIRLLYKLSGQLGNSSGRVSTSFPPRESQKSIPEPNYIYIYIYIYGHSQMPLRLVVDNHQIEQAQFSASPRRRPCLNDAQASKRSPWVGSELVVFFSVAAGFSCLQGKY